MLGMAVLVRSRPQFPVGVQVVDNNGDAKEDSTGVDVQILFLHGRVSLESLAISFPAGATDHFSSADCSIHQFFPQDPGLRWAFKCLVACQTLLGGLQPFRALKVLAYELSDEARVQRGLEEGVRQSMKKRSLNKVNNSISVGSWDQGDLCLNVLKRVLPSSVHCVFFILIHDCCCWLLLAAGCWLLLIAAGCWLLLIGSGCWLLLAAVG